MKAWQMTLAAVLVSLSATAVLAGGSCYNCGCNAKCKKVKCKIVETVKVVKDHFYTCECEDFCVPGPSCNTKCSTLGCCKQKYGCGCGDQVCKPAWCKWFCRKNLIKWECVREIPCYECVTVPLCGCCAGAVEANGGVLEPPPADDTPVPPPVEEAGYDVTDNEADELDAILPVAFDAKN